VSTVTRICDGALVVVDAVEGVCIQTHTVLHQAWREKLTPLLIVNKIDKLFTSLHMTPEEAYSHLRRVIEAVNAVTTALATNEWMEEIGEMEEDEEEEVKLEDIDKDSSWNFSPERGNVIFASASHGWGFMLMKFAQIWGDKLGVEKGNLVQAMWGDYSLQPKTNKIIKHTSSSSTPPIFVSLILQPIWSVYEACLVEDRPRRVVGMGEKVGVSISREEVDSCLNNQDVVSLFLSRWIPLNDVVMRSIVRKVPSPLDAQRDRIDVVWPKRKLRVGQSTKEEEDDETSLIETSPLKQTIEDCNSDDQLVVFISKMISMKRKLLDQTDVSWRDINRGGEDEVLVAMGRVFSGTLTSQSEVYILSHTHDPPDSPDFVPIPPDHCTLYNLFGDSISKVEEVPAGNIFAMSGFNKFHSHSFIHSFFPSFLGYDISRSV